MKEERVSGNTEFFFFIIRRGFGNFGSIFKKRTTPPLLHPKKLHPLNVKNWSLTWNLLILSTKKISIPPRFPTPLKQTLLWTNDCNGGCILGRPMAKAWRWVSLFKLSFILLIMHCLPITPFWALCNHVSPNDFLFQLDYQHPAGVCSHLDNCLSTLDKDM